MWSVGSDVLDELLEHRVEHDIALGQRDLDPNRLRTVGALERKAMEARTIVGGVGEKKLALVG